MADDEKILGIKKSELTELVRQILAEMPTSLPANGGNADYATNAGNANAVGGIQISDIRQITRNAIQTLPTPPVAECDYFVSNADSTFPYYFGNLSIRYGSYTAEFVAIYQTTGDDRNIWYNLYLGGWVGWKRINDGGNADTAKTLSGWGATPTLNLDNVDLGFIAASGEANSAPNTFWSTVLTVGQGVQSYAAQLAFPWLYDPSQAMKYRVLSNGIWYDWKEISTTPIKSEVTSTTTDSSGNAIIYASSENKKIISINCFAKQAVPFNYNDDQYGHFYENDGTPYVGSVSFCAYYIEG